MTTATTEGRRLMLRLEGIDEPIAVDPLPAKRGRALTEQFIRIASGQLAGGLAEQVLIEAIGASNYARIAGEYVDEFDENGAYIRTWGSTGAHARADLENTTVPKGTRYTHRDPLDGEAPLEGEPIRQEEAESLCLCAFYWQTVVGMEAVTTFLEGGEGATGHLKAMSLLQMRIGLSTLPSSSSSAMESVIRQRANSGGTAATGNSFGSVRRPADRKPPTGKRRFGRKSPS